MWLMGYPTPTSVLAATHNHLGKRKGEAENLQFDVEDLGAAMIRFDNGASLQLEVSWDGFEKDEESFGSRLLGTQGGCYWSGWKGEGTVITKRHGVTTEQTLVKPLPGPSSVPKHFADAILNDEPHLCTGEEGLALMQLLDGIYASAATGREYRFGS